MFGGLSYYYDIKRLLFDNVIALKTIILRGTNYWNYFIVQSFEDNVHPSFKYIRMSSECFEKRHLYRNNYIEKRNNKYRIVCNKQNDVELLVDAAQPTTDVHAKQLWSDGARRLAAAVRSGQLQVKQHSLDAGWRQAPQVARHDSCACEEECQGQLEDE